MKSGKAKPEPAKPLSRRTIAEGALAILRREGQSALSARRIASEVGCEAMSLYHHFDGMDDILDEVVDLILEGLALSAPSRNAAPAGVALAYARRYLSAADAEPECFRLIATRRWKGPNGRLRAQEMIDQFVASGVSSRRALASARALGAYLNGAGLALSAWKARGENARAVKSDLDAGLKTLIAALTARI